MNTDRIYAESIANEYAPKENTKIMALRKLDRKAKMPATIFAYTWGIIFALVFGTGMCLGMRCLFSARLDAFAEEPWASFHCRSNQGGRKSV